ncbi:T9SS type A sorting domain-containing protein [Flavobacterium sp. DG2-3]|uniref:T9SS type A sorting domain-containing protein n=1 Tax=Flavobacterium sp. DG2-3 TaxID=3068317 RepID=UPI00273D7060|nr:T9SS type A sorting domain-containing protein [Flavobacterium sp. DG2-3]MDP5198576.1 T9SS type A sorting domain-containing protein [Flavobacterium sp. DG2-3]
MKAKLLLLLLLANFSIYAQQYTKIPDPNFEKFLINEKYDSGTPDGQVLTANISAIKTLNVNGLNISDLTGIQDFKALTQLICSFNNLTSLDVSQNTSLTVLNCFSNKITSLNLSKNTSLDNLNCASNLLTALDISAITYIRTVNCYDNKLKALNLANNINLNSLNCSANDFTNGLNLFKNPYLTFLNCNFSNLTSLDLSENKSLQLLNCQGNSLKTLDLSNNIALTFVDCSSNQLKSLNLKNGKNTILTTTSTFKNNSNLSCIQVDNEVTATANWANLKDAAAVYNTDCSIEVPSTSIPDINFEKKLIALGIDSGVPDGKVPTSKINKLTNLDVSSSSITDLTGLQDFVSLTYFVNMYNNTPTVDLSKNVNLTFFRCERSNIENLNVSQNTKLTQLLFGDNKIKSVDLSKLTELKELYCYSNALTNIDLSSNVKLQTLYIYENQLTKLDLSKNAALTYVNARSNRSLTELNLKNGQNTLIKKGNLIATENTSLYCITVDDVDYANTNWSTGKDKSVDFTLTCSEPEYTLIPDVEFEKKLIYNGLDMVQDGKVLTKKIANAEYLNIDDAPITDLTGLEVFTNLKRLYCSKINVKDINLSKNTQLTEVNCSSNNLSSIDLSALVNLKILTLTNNNLTALNISKNQALERISVDKNKLTTIDFSANKALSIISCNSNLATNINVSENDALTYLDCSANKLSSINVSKNPKLIKLYVNTNSLTDIDLSQNIALTDFVGSANQLTSLNVTKNINLTSINVYLNKISNLNISKNTALTSIDCAYNSINTLDVSNNKALTKLHANTNKITDLDLSKNTALVHLSAGSNNLKSANLKNGNNTQMTYLDIDNNPNLSCIQVDDVAYANANWSAKKSAAASFNTDCSFYTAIPDIAFEQKLIDLGLDTDGKNGKVLTANISGVTSLDLSESQINDLTGIQGFTSLESLDAEKNNLTKIDLTKNQNLVSLNVAQNQLTTLNLISNVLLQAIYCNNNLLKTLDFSKNSSLTEIICSDNKLISLNLKNGNNASTSGPNVKNFTNNPDLTCIQVDNADYANTNWKNYKDATANYSSNCDYFTSIPDSKFEAKLIALGIDKDGENGKVATASILYVTELDVSSSSITNLTGIQDFVSLNTLLAQSNQLTTLDLSKNTSLTRLNVDFNVITSLNVSNNQYLTNLSAYYNKISSIDISKNTALTTLDLSYNGITTLDLSNHKALRNLKLLSTQLTSLNLKNGVNSLMNAANLSFASNLKLYCILVDDVDYANANWSNKKDSFATYNTECTGEINLPANNFTVETKGESCLGENNGEINIVGKASFAYNATINDKAYTFTNNSLKVAALTPGVYKIKITIPEMIFEQIFNVTIQKGATITGKSNVSAKNVEVEITEGTAPFTVFVDGTEQFQTTDANFTVALDKAGLVEVATAKACEGVYAKKVTSYELGTTLAAYPNPTSGIIEIEIPSTKTEVAIELYNFGGQLVSQGTYNIESGKAILNLEKLPSGIYAAKINLETPEYIKIIKN